jgi:hypothetical protein
MEGSGDDGRAVKKARRNKLHATHSPAHTFCWLGALGGDASTLCTLWVLSSCFFGIIARLSKASGGGGEYRQRRRAHAPRSWTAPLASWAWWTTRARWTPRACWTTRPRWAGACCACRAIFATLFATLFAIARTPTAITLHPLLAPAPAASASLAPPHPLHQPIQRPPRTLLHLLQINGPKCCPTKLVIAIVIVTSVSKHRLVGWRRPRVLKCVVGEDECLQTERTVRGLEHRGMGTAMHRSSAYQWYSR